MQIRLLWLCAFGRTFGLKHIETCFLKAAFSSHLNAMALALFRSIEFDAYFRPNQFAEFNLFRQSCWPRRSDSAWLTCFVNAMTCHHSWRSKTWIADSLGNWWQLHLRSKHFQAPHRTVMLTQDAARDLEKCMKVYESVLWEPTLAII